MSDLLDRIPFLPTNIGHSNQQHQDIVEAILRGDADGAYAAAAAHLQGTASLLHGFLVRPDDPRADMNPPGNPAG